MLKNNRGDSLVAALIYLLVFLFGVVGWIRNIVGFVQCDFKEPYKAEIIRGIGIPCVPMGVVCGFVEIKDE